MFHCFKDLRVAYCISVVFGAFGFFVLLLSGSFLPAFILGIILLFVWCICTLVILTAIAGFRLDSKEKSFEEGKAEEYRLFLEHLLSYQQRPINTNLLLLNLSAAYLEQGRMQDAMDALLRVDLSLATKVNHIQRLVYFNNLATCYLEMNDFSRAIQCLENFQADLESPWCNQRTRNQLKVLYQSKQALLKFLTEQISPAEARAVLEACSSFDERKVRSQVFYRFWIAKTYLAQEDYENAKQHLIFAAEQGGELQNAARARALLEQNYPRPQVQEK